MATRTGLGYAATGFIVAGSIIAATAATVGLRTQQASEVPAPSTLESALVANAAPPSAITVAPVAAAPPLSAPATQPAAQPVAPPAAQQFAATAAQPLTVAATSPRREHDDDEDDDDDEHEERRERESLKSLFTSFRREHR